MSDIISVFERNPPAPPSGRRQLSAPQTQASIRTPGCSPHEALGPHPKAPLEAESAIELWPAAVGHSSFWSGNVSFRCRELLFGCGGAQPAGATEAWPFDSVRAAAAGIAASPAAATCCVHTSPSLRSSCSTPGHAAHSPRCRPS